MDKIKAILEEYTAVPVSGSSELIKDLGLDSFLIVYFLTEIEDCFGIDINESDFDSFITVADVWERICQEKRTKLQADS